MNSQPLETFTGLASNETLREIVASTSPKWKWYRNPAKRELARRDLELGLALAPAPCPHTQRRPH